MCGRTARRRSPGYGLTLLRKPTLRRILAYQLNIPEEQAERLKLKRSHLIALIQWSEGSG